VSRSFRPAVRRALAIALLGAVLPTQPDAQSGADWGRTRPLPERPGLYWEKCGGCHGNAGAFAPTALAAVNDQLRLKADGQRLGAFLRNHRVPLDPDQLRILRETLHLIVSDGAAFQNRCAICHGAVDEFARTHLVLRNGGPTGRYSGRDTAVFLRNGHARLDPDEAAFFADVLARFAARN
jgi:mono/diheme cytochrome c family protein